MNQSKGACLHLNTALNSSLDNARFVSIRALKTSNSTAAKAGIFPICHRINHFYRRQKYHFTPSCQSYLELSLLLFRKRIRLEIHCTQRVGLWRPAADIYYRFFSFLMDDKSPTDSAILQERKKGKRLNQNF